MTRKQLLLLLALLITAVTGAWAQTSDKETPLTLQATADGEIRISDPKDGMQYKVGDGAKQMVTSTGTVEIPVTEGQTVQFFGNGTEINAYSGEQGYGTYFDSSVPCCIYGNIMSLVDETGFAKATALTADYAFKFLFFGFSDLSNHASRKLVLPATTLTKNCYYSMFAGCTGLTTAPALPATTLTKNCYDSMFAGCTGLTTAPALPATELAEQCYYSMFIDCTSLTTASALPATELATQCYQNMFDGCSSLTTAPLLPATTLADYCYCNMFKGCTKLNAVTCLATDISAEDATFNWLKGVAATGTLTIAKGMENKWAANSADGIPSGWTTDVYFFKVKLADNTEDADSWKGNVNDAETDVNLPITKLEGGEKVTLKYNGRLRVKDVTATTDAGPVWDGDLSKLTAESTAEFATATNGMTITGTLAANVKVSIAADATVTLDGVTIGGDNDENYKWAGLNCLGNATIVLKDRTENTVRGFYLHYPGIHVPAGSTLTITGGTEGSGMLTATSNGYGAGIGGGFQIYCGNIDIQGGNIRARGVIYGAGIGGGRDAICGNITISGGTVTAIGGSEAAGIGGGSNGHCGNITITNGVTRVIARKGGEEAPYSIGAGNRGSCVTVTIGGTLDTYGNPVGGTKYWENIAAVDSDADNYLAQPMIIYPEP